MNKKIEFVALDAIIRSSMWKNSIFLREQNGGNRKEVVLEKVLNYIGLLSIFVPSVLSFILRLVH